MPQQTSDAPNIADKGAASSRPTIDSKLIDQVGVSLEAFVGEARMTVGELTSLAEGSLVELDAVLGQAVELRLNGVAVARGELVAAGDRLAVRLAEIAR